MKRKLIICFLFFMIPFSLFAQLKMNFITSNTKDQSFLEQYISGKGEQQVADSVEGIKLCFKVLYALYDDGYLTASTDSVYIIQNVFTAKMTVGKRYKWLKLENGNVDREILSNAGVRPSLFEDKQFQPRIMDNVMKRLLQQYSNNGYPFAKIRLSEVNVTSEGLAAKLIAEPGILFTLDSIVIKGNSKLSYSYLTNYLSLKKGFPYNERKIEKISTRMRELPFIKELRPAEVEFSENKERVILYIDDKKASTFNGILGVQPDANNSKVNITGDVRLRLLNSFSHAELLDINWSNPMPKSQDLKVKLNYPFLFDTPFGLDVDLSIFKKDSTYLEFNRELGIQYFFTGNNYIKVYGGRKTSNLISTSNYEFSAVLPPFADVSSTIYGLGCKFERLDYRLNPRKGIVIEAQAGAGTKVISRNSKINEALYDSIDLTTTHYNGKGALDIYIPLAKRGVLNAGINGAWLFSPDIFENELFRFGGLKTLRGFNELSLLASQYIIGKLEYRFLLEQNSFLSLFANMAYYENRSKDKFVHDAPIGFGAGINFETKLGIFSFNYALGKEFDNPLLLRSAKIHFGVVNYF